jgi:hypothetical protein
LNEVVAFYRDGLGLPEIGHFSGHDGYSGVMPDLPETGAHLEFTASEHAVPPDAHVEDLLVLRLGNQHEVDRLVAQAGVRPVRSANPYWDRVGVTITDPDGFSVARGRLVADMSLPVPAAPVRRRPIVSDEHLTDVVRAVRGRTAGVYPDE